MLALVGVAALLPSTGVARAEAPKLAPNGFFHADGASGIAVDQPSGDVFTTGFIAQNEKAETHVGQSEKFGPSGNVLSPPSPFTEGLQYGAAVNPTNGRLYTASPFANEIEVYDPNTGARLSSFTVPAFVESFAGGEFLEEIAQIATDSAGDVYVPNAPGNKVLEYTEAGELLATFTGSGAHALKRPLGVAVDSSGNVWIADTGNNRVEQFDQTGAFLGEFESEGVRALALDGKGHVLAIVANSADSCEPITPPCEHLVDYSASGTRLTDVAAGFLGSSAFSILPESMVAVDEASGRVYVSDGLKERVWVFQPPLAPVLSNESSTEVGTSQAKLGALVNPGGLQTKYRFEYDTRAYGEGEGPHGVSVPFPEGIAGEGFSSRRVWASAGGLAPGATYHYRAVVTNALGTVVGPDETFTTVTAAEAACPNEQFRAGFSAALPDCRAYELVTPPSKATGEPDALTGGSFPEGGGFNRNYAAGDGSRFAYVSNEVIPGSPTAGLEFVATRAASGWTSQDEIPLQPYTGDRCTLAPFEDSAVERYSTNLSAAIVAVNKDGTSIPYDCTAEAVEVVSGEPLGIENLLLRDNETGTYRLINLTPPGVTPTRPNLVAASADLSVVIFDERAKLTSDALDNAVNRYEWREGAVRLLKFALPSGPPVLGSLVSVSGMSPDGSDVIFTLGGKLYASVQHGARTVQLDEPRGGGSGPGGGGAFAGGTADGSQVFFTDDAAAGLTSDTAPGSGANLYRYDVKTNQLTDLTAVSEANASLAGVSDDGSYVYFTSAGVLSGSQANQFGETAESGKQNLYLDHGATITFLIHGGGSSSANGAFLSTGPYLYSAASNRFACAGCAPSGEGATARPGPPTDDGQVFFQTAEALLPRDTNGMVDVYEFDYYSGLHLISTGTSASPSQLLGTSASGSDVFFLTRQSLVPRDSTDEAYKIYDARTDGGFPETEPPPCTTADACRSAPASQPSVFGEPASQTFSGAGNLAPSPPPPPSPKHASTRCKKGFVKNKKGKCVKKPKRKARHASRHKRRGH